MQSFSSWYGQATATLREAARRKRAADRAAGRRDPVEALSIDWDAWQASQDAADPEEGSAPVDR